MLKFLFLFLGICQIAAAQEDRVYYDNEWVKCNHKHASYYRIYTMQDSIYKVDDYYLFDKLFRTGYRTSIKSESIIYRTGHYVFYDSSGHKMREGDYGNGRRLGLWRYYHLYSDALRREEYYQNDSLVGVSFDYDSLSHSLIRKTERPNNGATRIWEYEGLDSALTIRRFNGIIVEESKFYKDGKIKEKTTTQGLKTISSQCYNEKGELVVCDSTKKYTYCEQMPSPGFNLSSYLSDNLIYPEKARIGKVTGRVIVKFVIDEDGTITNVNLLRGIGAGCDEEAMRVIATMPPWNPGKQNGIPVRVYFTQPITFNLR